MEPEAAVATTDVEPKAVVAANDVEAAAAAIATATTDMKAEASASTAAGNMEFEVAVADDGVETMWILRPLLPLPTTMTQSSFCRRHGVEGHHRGLQDGGKGRCYHHHMDPEDADTNDVEPVVAAASGGRGCSYHRQRGSGGTNSEAATAATLDCKATIAAAGMT